MNTLDFFSGTTETYLRKSKGMSEQSIENITISDNTFAPSLVNSAQYQMQNLRDTV